ncbi:hypothetical protein QEH53_09445 [Pelagicoccus sp. SDUM812002]|nr:hypothetical protein [Pelagicoccus sp. SDUM812002]
MVVTVVLAILGAMEGLRHHHSWLFAEAKFQAASKSDQLNYITGGQSSWIIDVKNSAVIGVGSVFAIDLYACAGGERLVEWPPDLSDRLSSSERMASGAGGTLGFKVDGLGEGTYEIHLNLEGKSGLARVKWKNIVSVPLRVWQPVSRALGSKIIESDKCRFEVVISSGAYFPEGLVIRTSLENKYGVTFERIIPTEFRLGPSKSIFNTPNSTKVIQAETSSLGPFRDYRLTIYMRGERKNESDWNEIIDHVYKNMILRKNG